MRKAPNIQMEDVSNFNFFFFWKSAKIYHEIRWNNFIYFIQNKFLFITLDVITIIWLLTPIIIVWKINKVNVIDKKNEFRTDDKYFQYIVPKKNTKKQDDYT